MARRYVFWGGYGGNNLGDEAILWAMSRLIHRLDPAAEQHVFIPSGVSEAVRAQYAAWDIHVVSGPLLRCFAIFRHARLIVGGGQMIDDSSHGWPVGWSSLFLTANRLCGYRPVVLCVGAEQLTKPLPRFLVRRAYGLAEVITCRDEEASAAVRDTGVPASKVWTTRDVVFSLDRAALPPRSATSGSPRSVAVVVAYDPARVQEDISRYTRLVNGLRNRGFAVELVAHDLRPAYDVQAVREVKAAFPEDSGVRVAPAATVGDVCAIYARVDAVLSARMHPLIMGLLAGTLPVAFGGKAKVKSLLAIAGIPAIAPEGDPLELASRFEAILAERETLLPRLAETADDFRRTVEDTTARALHHNGDSA